MINMALAMEKFALYANIDSDEAERWRSLVSSALQKLEKMLKEDADTHENGALLASAAAADAFYRYCLAENGRGDAWMTVGSVSVKADPKIRLESAQEMRNEALVAVCDLLKDGGFLFLRT